MATSGDPLPLPQRAAGRAPADIAAAVQAPETNSPLVRAAREYARKVSSHSRQSTHQTLYPGRNYDSFAKFLGRCFSSSPPGPSAWLSRAHRSVLTFYQLSSLRSEWRITEVADAHQCAQLLETCAESTASAILFLRGYPSPEWLASIGSLCEIDPEYFLRHFSFQISKEFFALPCLPSSGDNILKLRITTVGRRQVSERKKRVSKSDHVNELRRNAAKDMEDYHKRLLWGLATDTGDSVVRRYSVHTDSLFSIEQEISICVTRVGQQWFSLIWLDAGHDLASSVGPWGEEGENASRRAELLPTIQHDKHMALKSSSLRVFHELQNNQDLKFPQSACLLTKDYGKLLDPAIMAADPFYAMSELFKFCASSESQFLNMVESVLAPETGFKVLDQGVLTLANLLYHQEILEEHALILRELVRVIKHRGDLDWPRSPMLQRGRSEAAASKLLEDYEHLLSRTEYLLRRCENGMRVIMNNATIDQARKAREQEKGMQSAATRFAFFYIPLSFVTGFYGMNFEVFGTGKLSLWVFFATAIPFLFISIIFLVFDIQNGFKRLIEKSVQLFRELFFQSY